MAKQIAAAALLVILPTILSAQAVFKRDTPKGAGARTWLAERAKLPPFTAPRTADGQPNLQGQWGGSSSGDDIEETEYVDLTTPPWESYISNPPDGKIPYQPWARAARNAHRAGLSRGWPGETGQRLYTDPQTFCLKTVPRYAQRGFELVQTRGSVTMLLNWGHFYRVIPLDGRPHPASSYRAWMGNARGRWEGDTLVIDVTNLNGKLWLDSVGNFYSENAHITERFRLVEANTIDYEVTIDDPTVFTQPWTLSYRLRRAGTGGGGGGAQTREPDPYAAESWEHACHEGNWHHIDGVKALGFKWYTGETPPAAR